MKQMYIITAAGNTVDGPWQHIEYITDNLIKGTEFVDKQNALQSKVDAAEHQIDMFMTNWAKSNPAPHADDDNMIPTVDWLEQYTLAEKEYIENTYANSEIKNAVKLNLFGALWSISPINWLP